MDLTAGVIGRDRRENLEKNPDSSGDCTIIRIGKANVEHLEQWRNEMQGEIKVVQYGVGAKGKAMVELMLKKAGIAVVGAVDIVNIGRDLGEVVGLGRKIGVNISDNLDAVLAQTKPDVMLDASLPYTKQLYPIFAKALEARVNIISIAPQAFNPWANEPELAKKLDETAKRKGVTLVGTGTGTGFYSDVLPLFFTGICGTLKKIKYDRVTDVAKGGLPFRKRSGIGLSKDEAERRLATGEVKIGLAYSDDVYFIADSLGWRLSSVREEKEFLISKTVRDDIPDHRIQSGQVYGFRYSCYGIKDQEPVIEIKNIIGVEPALDGFEVHFTLTFEGEPSFTIDASELCLSKNIKITVAARAVNWIPHIIRAKPGLLTNAWDLPLVTCLPEKE